MTATTAGRLRAQSAIDALELEGPVDQSAWSPQRIRAYAEGPTVDAAPLAVLRIPRLKLAVPILEGIGAQVLDRGVGHIPETARPGEAGNIGIAGHRDSFFRGLKDVRAGDEIEVALRGARDRYVVERTWIVDPEDLSVLAPTAAPSMTLVTCYPFYYVGSAPRRYIVRAVRAGREVANR
jgi:sortase A